MQVLTSGWVLEPVRTSRGKIHTLVTYLLQVGSTCATGAAPSPRLAVLAYIPGAALGGQTMTSLHSGGGGQVALKSMNE